MLIPSVPEELLFSSVYVVIFHVATLLASFTLITQFFYVHKGLINYCCVIIKAAKAGKLLSKQANH